MAVKIVCDKRTVFLVCFFVSDEATSDLLNNVTSACVRINLVGSKDPFWTKTSLKYYLGDRSQRAALRTDTSCMFSSYVKPPSETQGQSVGSGERTWRKFSSTGERAPRYRLSPNYFQKSKQMPASDWAQKMLCIIVPNQRTVSPEFFSGVRTRRLLSWSRLVWLTHQRNARSQEAFTLTENPHLISKYCLPENLTTLVQKYKLELTTGIHSCIGHVLCKY